MWFRKRQATVPAPFIVPPTGEFEGSDGNWSTFKIGVGTPQQEFRVTVSSIGDSIWLPQAPGACGPADGVPSPSDCPSLRGVYNFNGGISPGYQPNQSTSYDTIGTYGVSLNADLQQGSMTAVYGDLYNISAYYATDAVTLKAASSDAAFTVQNVPVAGLNDQYDFTLGSLGLAWGSINSGPGTHLTFMETLVNMNMIPSRSWAYTAGAQYRETLVLALGTSSANRYLRQRVSGKSCARGL